MMKACIKNKYNFKDFNYNEKVPLLAYKLKEDGNKVQAWIAKDVIKELEDVVKVDNRKRIISAYNKMGRKYHI